jgi:small multidrug resistance pump
LKWFFLLAAIIAEVIGTSALKSSEGFTRPFPSAIVIIAGVVVINFFSKSVSS